MGNSKQKQNTEKSRIRPYNLLFRNNTPQSNREVVEKLEEELEMTVELVDFEVVHRTDYEGMDCTGTMLPQCDILVRARYRE
jgi:hypothetical protein